MARFLLRVAWRETRAGWRHFVFFLSCIALGVGAIVGIGLFADHVEQAVLREARGLHGGDLEVRLSHRLSESGEEVLRGLRTRGIETSHASELVAMAAVDRGGQASTLPATQLVELKAVEKNYPLYGTLRLDPDRPLSELLGTAPTPCRVRSSSPPASPRTPYGSCFGAVVHESLLIRMGLSVGEVVNIGAASFQITGTVRTEPDRMANMFSLGPRVLISQQGLAAADLVKPGSRVRERYLLKTPEAQTLAPLLYELRGRLSSHSVRVSTYREAQPQLKQFLEQLSRYLGLIGLTALFVGGIGIAMSIHAFLQEKIEHVAILKTVGADSTLILLLYVMQTLGLALVGSIAGVAIGLLLQAVLPQTLAGLLGSNLLEQVAFSTRLTTASLAPIAKGFVLGVLTTLLFTLWPLLNIREMQPAVIFRRGLTPDSDASRQLTTSPGLRAWMRTHLRRDSLATLFVIGGGLLVLSFWQAASWQLGALFIGGLLLAVLLLLVAARGLLGALPLVPLPRSVGLRHALGNLTRPGSHATGMIAALGIGVMVILTVALLERSLVTQLGESRPSDAPAFFFIDIQPDQADGFAALLRRQTGGPTPTLTPLVRSRLYALNGRPVTAKDEPEPDRGSREEKRKAWYLTREYVLTFMEHLPKDNSLVKGQWWPQGPTPGTPLVSVEEEAARHLGLDVGSHITLDIQGALVTAEVSSIRKVTWGNFSTNFYLILSPGSLDGAPMTYVATVTLPPQQEVPLQQAVVAAYPNVTAIHVGDVLASFTRMLDRLSLAIRAVALFCIFAAGLVMGAALAVTRYRRLYESLILKALGATRGLVAQAFAMEYLLLGLVAGLVGLLLACALSWAILHFVFDLTWTVQPTLLTVGLASTVLLTVVIGFWGTFGLLGQRPLSILRRE